MKLLLGLLMRAGISSGVSPLVNIDLTSALDSRITFTRAGARNYINNGVLTALGTGLPAFESWDGVSRGMAIEPGFTNMLTYSNDPTQGVWAKDTVSAPTLGDVGPGLITQMYEVANTVTTGPHCLYRETSSIAAGTTTTLTAFIKPAAGATNFGVLFRASNQWNNGGVKFAARIDGVEGVVPLVDTAIATNLNFVYRKLSGGIYQIGLTCTWVDTGNKEITIGCASNLSAADIYYLGTVDQKFQIFGAQLAQASGPTGYVATTGSTASQAAESAIINDTAWLNTSQGTFIVDHDCWAGPLIGSGANTVLGATTRGSTAIAWSGVTSDTVSNGGSAASGVQPTFSGSDIRLLSTSGASATGHIKRIRYYATRLSVAEIQALTTPVVVPTATPGVLRGAAIENRLPSGLHVTTGSDLYFSTRFQFVIGSSPMASLRLDFPNIGFAGDSSANAISIESCALERETGVAEFAPVLFSGLRTASIPANANTTFLSDTILPGAFTGLSTFPAGMKFWVRIRGFVASAGQTIPQSRFEAEAGSLARVHPAAGQYSPVDATGTMAYVSGPGGTSLAQMYAPILVGTPVSGDPLSLFLVGDSIIEGTGNNNIEGNYVQIAARNLGIPLLEMSKGGTSQYEASVATAAWTPYMKYARVLLDEFGTNNQGNAFAFFAYWDVARKVHNYSDIMRVGLFPNCSNSGDFSSEGVQTVARSYPRAFPDMWADELLRAGVIGRYFSAQSIRGVDKAKWLTNGTPGYLTTDGTHQMPAANTLMAAELEPILSSLVIDT